ncbi:MAG: hypothetical protein WCE79_02500 [Xanthobacteraceae bacterium]
MRIAGPVACVALLLYGIVSLSRPHHAYVLSFSFTGETKGALEAAIRLDDGVVTAPAAALAGDKSIHVVALPTRTIRGLRLFVGQEAGAKTIRDLQVARLSGAPSPSALRDPRNIYRKIDLNAALTTEGLRIEYSSAEALTFETLAGASSPFLQVDLAPLHLLRDTQIAWAERAFVALIVAAMLIWLYGRVRSPTSLSHIADGLHGRPATVASAALWFVVTFAVYFIYAGRIESFGWNSIEFIIANHLQDFGRYALGANYPAAIWRPVGPTFIVMTIDAFVRDPLLTYQLLAGFALASLVTSTYQLNRLLFGQLLAHAGAALAFTTPLVSVSLINHAHSISHLCFLLVASPTLLASVVCILSARDGKPVVGWLWAASIGWALCYLCRPESVLMAVCFFLVIGVMAVRRRQIAPLVLPLAAFIAIFAAFNVWASTNAARDDIWSRKIIYLFYASQGWTEIFDRGDRAATQASDRESAGYARAIELYGAPAENSENLFYAIARNPNAFVARVASNLKQSVDLLAKGRALPIVLLLLILALPFSIWLLSPQFRLVAAFAAAVASAVGIFLIFHIDDRYLTIAVPAALLLGALSAYGLNRLPMPERFARDVFASLLLLIALGNLALHFVTLSSALQRERMDLSAFRLIGEGFRTVIHGPREDKQQIIAQLDVPLPPAFKFNAILLLFPYFAHTSLFLPEQDSVYPRDRLFSVPRCPATHAVLPEEAVAKDNSALGTFVVPQVGNLAVVRLAGPASANRFCARTLDR